MGYLLKLSPDFDKDLKSFKRNGELKAIHKVDALLDELKDHPRTGTGKPERLKGYGEQERWSRRISDKHRLVYEIQARLTHAHLLFASALKCKLSCYSQLMDIMMRNKIFSLFLIILTCSL